MRGPHLVLSVGGLFSLIGLARLARHKARDYDRVSEAGAILASAGYEYVGTALLPILIGFGWTVLGYALWSYKAKASSAAHLEGI